MVTQEKFSNEILCTRTCDLSSLMIGRVPGAKFNTGCIEGGRGREGGSDEEREEGREGGREEG